MLVPENKKELDLTEKQETFLTALFGEAKGNPRVAGDIAGYAGALYGFMQVSGAAVLAAFAAYLPDDNQLILAITITITSITSWLLYELLVRNDINQT